MKPKSTGNRNSLKRTLSVLLSLWLLLGNLGVPAATAEGTQYYSSGEWVLLAPTPVPEAGTPAALTATADGVTFTVQPAADSPIAGATLSVSRVTDTAMLSGAAGAYADAFTAGSAANSDGLQLYQLTFTADGAAVAPSGIAVTASGKVSDFAPAQGMPFHWQAGVASLGNAADAERTGDAWATALTLTDSGMVLFAAAAGAPAATETPEAESGVYTFNNGRIALTATVGGSLPPQGAQFFVEPVSGAQATAAAADGSALDAVLAYHVGFRTAEGELGAPDPLSVHLTVLSAGDYAAATALVTANGDVLWRSSGEGGDAPSSFDFSLPVGGTFILAAPQAKPEASQAPAQEQPSAFTFENGDVRVNVTVSDPTALPAGTQFTASLTQAGWDAYAAPLTDQGFDETGARGLWTLSGAFTLLGQPVDVSGQTLRYQVTLKGASTDGAQAWILHNGAAEFPDDFTQTGDGAQLAFSLSGETDAGIALMQPLVAAFASFMAYAASPELDFATIASNITFAMKVNGVDVTGQHVTVDRDANVQITMAYSLSNTAPIDSTATYVYDLTSNGVTVMDLTTPQDVSYGGQTVGKFHVQNNKLYVTYNEGFVVESNKTGIFTISAKLNPNSTGTETSHTYTIGESTQTITVNFNQGSFSLAKDYLLPVSLNGTVGVRLTITANQEITSASFEDTLSGTLLTGVVADSLKVDGTATTFGYNSGTKKLTFSVGKLAAGTHYVEYTATVDKSIFGGVSDPGAQTKNTVVMNLVSNGNTTLTDWDQIGWVYDSNNLITKDGWTDTSATAGTGLVTIYWRVTYNRNRAAVNATNPKIVETIPDGLTLTNVYERVNDGASTEISHALSGGVYTYAIGSNLNNKVELIFKTTVPLADAAGKTYNNTAVYKADDWPDVKATAGVNVGKPGIDFAKWVNSTNASAKTAQWKLAVTANGGAATLTAPTTIEDWVDANNAYQSAYTSLDRIYYTDASGEHNLALNTDYTYTIGSSVADLGSTNGSPSGKLTINLSKDVPLPLYVVYSTAHDATGIAPGTATFYNKAKITATVNGQSITKYADANWTKQANYTAAKDARGSIQYDANGHATILWVYSTMANNGTTFAVGTPVTVVDTLPDGITYDPGTAYVGSDTYGYNRNNFNLNNMSQTEPTVSADGKTLTWTFTPTVAGQTSVNVVFRTLFSRALLATINNATGTTISLTNKAETSIGGSSVASDDHNWTRAFTNQSILSKGADSYSANKSDLLFRVEVNKNALNLSDNDTLTLTDTLADYLTFDPGVENALTVSAYDGSTATPLSASQYHYTYADNKLTITIPDEKRLLITFRAYLSGIVGSTVEVKNTVKLEGIENSSTGMDQSFVVQEASGSVRNTNLTVQVKKYDQEGAPLPDAEFTIFKLTPAGVRGDATVTFVTNAQGVKIVEGRTVNGDSPTGVLQYDQLYELVETRAPAGYEKSLATIRFIFPWIIDGVITADSQTLLNQITANGLTYRMFMGEVTGSMTVTDKKIANIALHVNKAWKYADGTAFSGATPDVTVQLMQNGANYGDAVVLTAAGGYAHDFTNLPQTNADGVVFTYAITEVGAAPGFLYQGAGEDTDSTQNLAYTLTNRPTVVYFSKQSLTGGTEISGAQLTLTDITPVAGQAVTAWSWESGATPHVIAGELIAGHTFTLTEVLAPDGYSTAETITFTLGANGVISATGADGKPAANGAGDVNATTATVTMKDAPLRVTFSKQATGAGTAELAGATLTVSHSEGGKTVMDDQWVSGDANHQDSSGKPIPHVVTSGLKADGVTEYTFSEIGAPNGYTIAGSLVFRIAPDGTVQVKQPNGTFASAANNTVVMTDAPIHVTFSKQATGAGTAELAGATLTVSHSEGGKTVMDDQWVSGDANHQDSSGKPIPHVVTGGLKADGVTEYTFSEIGAPDGYTVAGSLVFRIAPDGTVQVKQPDGTFASAANNTVVMTDAPIRFKVAKVDAASGAYLAGAEFKVVPDVSGAPGATAVAGFERIVSGTAPVVVEKLAAGSYWLVETKAPVGADAAGKPVYYQTAAPVAFSVTSELLSQNDLVTVTVEDTPTDVTVLKLDSAALDAAGNPTGKRVAGATLTLTRKSDGAVLGTHTFDGTVDWVLNTGLLQPGVTYVLNETVEGTPDGYLCAYQQEFTLAADGSDRWIVVDQPIPLRAIVVNKVWNDAGLAHGTVYIDLYRSDNSVTPYRTATLSAPDTAVSFEGLLTQAKDHSSYSYIIRERMVAGYLPGVFAGPVTSADGATYTYTVTNTPTKLTVNKRAADTGAQQAGAHLTLVKGNGVGYTDADVVEAWVSGTDGVNADGTYKPHILLGKLTVNQQYTLLETAPPAGYAAAAGITFTYLDTGVTSLSGTDEITMTDQPVTVLFGKLDNLTGKLMAGAKFNVYKDSEWQVKKAAATPVYTFTSATTLTEVKALFTAGELYRLVETKAPGGYQLNASPLQFRAPSDGTPVTVTMRNARIYTLYKLNSKTGQSVSGAVVQVVDMNGTIVIPPWTTSGSPYQFVNSDENGNPILKAGVSYRYMELTAPKGFVLNATGVVFKLDQAGLWEGGSTITLDNTPTGGGGGGDTLDLTLKKTWVDHSNAGDTRPQGGLKVNIYRKLPTETLYSTLVMSVTMPRHNTNTWTFVVHDLPRYNAQHIAYDYLASEVVPAGYTVTYTNNGFTMVNTYPDNQASPTPTPLPTLTPTPEPSGTRVPAGVKYVDGHWVYIDEYGVPLGAVPQTGDESNYLLWGLAIALPLLAAGVTGYLALRKKRRETEAAAHSK